MTDQKEKPGLLDLRHPMFKPLWARLLFIGLVAGWGVFEAVGGEYVWGALFGAAAIYLVYGFFLSPHRAYFSGEEEGAATDQGDK